MFKKIWKKLGDIARWRRHKIGRRDTRYWLKEARKLQAEGLPKKEIRKRLRAAKARNDAIQAAMNALRAP